MEFKPIECICDDCQKKYLRVRKRQRICPSCKRNSDMIRYMNMRETLKNRKANSYLQSQRIVEKQIINKLKVKMLAQ